MFTAVTNRTASSLFAESFGLSLGLLALLTFLSLVLSAFSSVELSGLSLAGLTDAFASMKADLDTLGEDARGVLLDFLNGPVMDALYDAHNSFEDAVGGAIEDQMPDSGASMFDAPAY